MTARAEVIGDALLILGDGREVLRSVGPVDAVVTDPPYGIGYVHSGKGNRRKAGRSRGVYLPRHSQALAGDDTPFDPTWLISAAPQQIVWGADHFYPRLPDGGRWLAWDKLAGTFSFDSFADVEFAWQNRESCARVFSHLWKGLCKGSEVGERRVHPTQKPVALMAWCITQLTGAPRVIADPYMGAGSTGVAAIRAGRRFVGVEIDPGHFAAACERIAAGHRQRPLFGAEADA